MFDAKELALFKSIDKSLKRIATALEHIDNNMPKIEITQPKDVINCGFEFDDDDRK